MRACCRVEDNVAHQFKMMVFVCISGILSDGTRNRAEALKQAADRNAQPLPQIRHNFGLKLPNDRSASVYCNDGETLIGKWSTITLQVLPPSTQRRMARF